MISDGFYAFYAVLKVDLGRLRLFLPFYLVVRGEVILLFICRVTDLRKLNFHLWDIDLGKAYGF